MKDEKDIARIEEALRQHLGDRRKPEVPDGYFAQFGERLQQRIREAQTQSEKQFRLNGWLLPLTAAAAFALLFLFSTVQEEQAETLTAMDQPLNLSTLIEEDREAEVEVVLNDEAIREQELLPQVDVYILETELADSYTPKKKEDFELALQEVSNEQMEDYLMDHLNYAEL